MEILVDNVLMGRVAGQYPLPDPAREMLRLLRWHKGAEHAKPLGELAALLKVTPRDAKQIKKTLVEDFGIPIGASRQEPYGYFLCISPEDYELARRPFEGELLSIVRHLRALDGGDRVREMLGQLKLELEREAG